MLQCTVCDLGLDSEYLVNQYRTLHEYALSVVCKSFPHRLYATEFEGQNLS